MKGQSTSSLGGVANTPERCRPEASQQAGVNFEIQQGQCRVLPLGTMTPGTSTGWG